MHTPKFFRRFMHIYKDIQAHAEMFQETRLNLLGGHASAEIY
jgi:hypothetical protein